LYNYAPKDDAAKMPFFIRQKNADHVKKFLSKILDLLTIFSIPKLALLLQHFHLISLLYNSGFVAKSVESL